MPSVTVHSPEDLEDPGDLVGPGHSGSAGDDASFGDPDGIGGHEDVNSSGGIPADGHGAKPDDGHGPLLLPVGSAPKNSSKVGLAGLTTTDLPEPKVLHGEGNPLLASFCLGFLCVACFLGNSAYTWARSRGPEGEGGEDQSGEAASNNCETETLNLEDVDEDVFSLTVLSLTHDLQRLARDGGSVHGGLRKARLVTSVGLAFLCMAMQASLMYFALRFSVSKAVTNIRAAYDVYEEIMYNGHCFKTVNGFHRGLADEYFDVSRFELLDDNQKAGVCMIPMSQPAFLGLFLLIWTMLVFGEMRDNLVLFDRLVLKTETVESMKDSIKLQGANKVIVGLTMRVKAFATLCLHLPRWLMSCVLLWLGCRWLTATNNFGNVVCTTVALGFVLAMKDVLYKALAPDRSKRDTCSLKVAIAHEASAPTPLAFFGTLMWGFAALCWVYVYMFWLQSVLPFYQWDVRDVCTPWTLRWAKANP